MHEINDLLGLLAVLLQFSGVGAVSVRAYMLRRQQAHTYKLGLSGTLIVLAGAWLFLNLFDVRSVWGAVGNGLEDIPPVTTLRVAVFGVWLWVFHTVLMRLAKEELK